MDLYREKIRKKWMDDVLGIEQDFRLILFTVNLNISYLRTLKRVLLFNTHRALYQKFIIISAKPDMEYLYGIHGNNIYCTPLLIFKKEAGAVLEIANGNEEYLSRIYQSYKILSCKQVYLEKLYFLIGYFSHKGLIEHSIYNNIGQLNISFIPDFLK